MATLDEQLNNPLHGLKLEVLLNELVDHYGWEILADAINVNCFKQNPSIKASLKFLRKTQWAQEKVEGFYLYQFKNLPRADDEQFELPPRERIIPADQKPGEPAEVTLGEFAEQREVNTRVYEQKQKQRNDKRTTSSKKKSSIPSDPWGNSPS
jgi:uncharacterized protein (DUF2132 family)